MSDDFNSLGGDIVLSVLQHDGLTADEETVGLLPNAPAQEHDHCFFKFECVRVVGSCRSRALSTDRMCGCGVA